MTETYPVHILCSAGGVVVARVRDDSGIWDVTHGATSSTWACSCGDLSCSHRDAVRQTLKAAAI